MAFIGRSKIISLPRIIINKTQTMNQTEVQTKITLEDLALMVKKGFGEMDKNFAELRGRVDTIEGSMATKDDIKRIEHRFIAVEKTVYDDHHPRLRKLEKKLQAA